MKDSYFEAAVIQRNECAFILKMCQSVVSVLLSDEDEGGRETLLVFGDKDSFEQNRLLIID